MGHDEPRWRTNSSFSPPPLRIWDCRIHSDGVPHGSYGGALHGSSLSSNSREARSRVDGRHYSKHQHAASDGMLSYSGSPSDNIHVPQWTSPNQKFNLGELGASNVGGSMSQPTWFPHSVEREYAFKAAAAFPSFGSPSSLSESNHLESTSKQPLNFSNHNFPCRRSYVSKSVYPLVFRNPVSDCETLGDADVSSVGRLTPCGDRSSPLHFPDYSSSIEQKFQKTLSDLQRSEASPDPNATSRREGFRWSGASSYDLGLDGERFDMAEHMDVDSLRPPAGHVVDQKCGYCGKLLLQKSPWSSHRIIRGGDMLTAGVLPCGHVFHAECLEEVTPKSQIHDPPCPLCLKTIGAVEESSSVSEPLQMALRALRRSRGVTISEPQGNDETSYDSKDRLRRNWPRIATIRKDSSSLKNRLKMHFSFKGKESKDVFSNMELKKIGPSSSSGKAVCCQMSRQ